MAEQPEFRPSNFTIQEASQYKADIDSSIALLGRIAAAFAAHEKPSIAEVSEVTTVADVAGNLDGKYFTLSAPSEDFYVFLNSLDTSGIPDPGLSGATGIQVDYSDDDSAATIAAAINAAVDAEALLNSSVSGAIVTISNRDQGSATDISDGLSGNATGFGFVIPTQGGDGPDDLSVHIDAGYVSNDPLVSGNNGLEEIAAQIISEGSGSILAPTTNPRIDRIVIDIISGTAELVSGTEAASPVAPDIPTGKTPNCQFRLETSTTIITNSLIIEERVVVEYGDPSLFTTLNIFNELTQDFTTDFATDDKLDITAHGYSNDLVLQMTTSGTLPGGLLLATTYFVINVTANDFEVSLTKGGSAVDITDDGTGTHTATPHFIVPSTITQLFVEVYGGGGGGASFLAKGGK